MLMAVNLGLGDEVPALLDAAARREVTDHQCVSRRDRGNDVIEDAVSDRLGENRLVAVRSEVLLEGLALETAAGGGVDYTLPAGTLTFAPGVTIRSIPLSIVNDGVGENDETIEVTLSNPMGGTALGFRNKHTYTIVDPRPKVSFAVDASSGLESVTPAKITASLSAASTNTVTVNYAVSGGTATGGGVDYTLPNGTLSFSPGQVTTNISLAVVNDLLSESNETVVITLAAPGNATLGVTTQHTYTIVDDDSGLRWDNLTWFYNVAPTLLFINASNQLEWDPHQDGQFSTRLPDQRLSVVGDKVQIVYYWLTDGDYGVCPDCFACLKPGQNNATCSDNDIHCIAGTSDMRIGLFQSDGEYITADGYNVASNSIFAGYKGYSFRFGPNMMHDDSLSSATKSSSGKFIQQCAQLLLHRSVSSISSLPKIGFALCQRLALLITCVLT